MGSDMRGRLEIVLCVDEVFISHLIGHGFVINQVSHRFRRIGQEHLVGNHTEYPSRLTE